MDRLAYCSGPDPGLTPSDLLDYLGTGSQIHSDPLEQLSLVHIIQSDNVMMAKVLLALSSITDEMQTLNEHAKADYFNPLLFYGEDGNNTQNEEGQAHVWISRMLPILQDLADFRGHCSRVVENALGQLAALHDKEAKKLISIGDSHFQVIPFEVVKISPGRFDTFHASGLADL